MLSFTSHRDNLPGMNTIKQHREGAGLSQQKLAGSVGWSQNRWSNYELGKRTPDIDDARGIVRAFQANGIQASLDSLFPMEEERVDHQEAVAAA